MGKTLGPSFVKVAILGRGVVSRKVWCIKTLPTFKFFPAFPESSLHLHLNDEIIRLFSSGQNKGHKKN